MRWFLDTEFDDNGKTIELISLGLVSEVGHSYYAVSNEFDPERCSDWVKQNVLPNLGTSVRCARSTIALNVREMLLSDDVVPEVWAYFGSYDWVALCQLYGSKGDLPKGFPFLYRELDQLMAERRLSLHDLPHRSVNHPSLAVAEWVRDAVLWIRQHDKKADEIEDLKTARLHLDRELNRRLRARAEG